MAKTLKAGEAEKGAVELSPDSFRRWITDIVRLKADAKERNGMAGQATNQAVEATGLDKRAVTLTATLQRMEPAKRTTIVEDILSAFDAMGWTEEETLFGTPKEQAAAKKTAATNDEVDPFDAAAPEPPAPPADKPKKGKGISGTDLQKAVESAGVH
jgi:hypothetical protein